MDVESELREALGPELADGALDYFRPARFEHALILEARGPEPPGPELTEIRRRLLEVALARACVPGSTTSA